ncbi:MerR family transcriptional regulator [Amycolatopsis taiwanensis]|uniref:MerR family transcriptional regulator n=1 Tax=Amycolatopsis taiwanensis TaxID=342230 RepID=UPI00255481C4|nr:MerR family transcriptional regulator [Amycolatopsis taiwanensis]
MRTVDVARRAGCSVQQVRNLERDGVLPPARRTDNGYRIYGEIHVRSALAYQALSAGAGPPEARKIIRAAHESAVPAMLALLDAAHARLDTERTELRQAKRAAEAISDEPIEDVRPADSMSISELAAALGVRPSTLRHWDAEGLAIPDRDSTRGTRRYTPAQVRDARIVHQLRKAGYRIEPLRTLMPELRRTRRSEEVIAALAARDASIEARSRALLDGAAALSSVLSLVTGNSGS